MARSRVRVLQRHPTPTHKTAVYRADLTFRYRRQNLKKLPFWATRVVAGPTVRQAEQTQHWDDRKSQSPRVMRGICPRRSGRTWQERLWNRFNREKQMTSDARRSCVPELSPLGAQPNTAQFSIAKQPVGLRVLYIWGRLVWLEPCEGKLSCTVLRGRERVTSRAYPAYARAQEQFPAIS